MSDESASSKQITRGSLLFAELSGKHEAIGRYDTILWRVRSGYVAVLYGSLLLFAGKQDGLGHIFASTATAFATIATIAVLSIVLVLMDLGFRLRQLKVVGACNQLSDVAFALASGEEIRGDEVRALLHDAGESALPVAARKRAHAVLLIFALYLATPLLAVAICSFGPDCHPQRASGASMLTRNSASRRLPCLDIVVRHGGPVSSTMSPVLQRARACGV